MLSDLSYAEHRLLEHAGTGQPLLLEPSADSSSIRAELLVELLTGVRQPPSGGFRAIILSNARVVEGSLDLNAAIVSCPVVAFVDCVFDEPVDLRTTHVGSFAMAGGSVPSVMAGRLRASDSVNFSGLTTSSINLIAAHIGGQLTLNGAQLESVDDFALDAWGLAVDHDMWCQQGFHAIGGVRLGGASIGGSFGLDGATLVRPHGFALDARQLEVAREMSCSEGFSAQGAVSLSDGHVRGVLDLRGATLAYEDGYALDATRLTVGQEVLAGTNFRVEGTVCLAGARVTGSVILTGSKVWRENRVALDATNLTAGKDLVFGGGCDIQGSVNLLDAQIGGIVDIRDTSLTNERGRAFGADRIAVSGAVIGRAETADPGAGVESEDGTRLTVTGEFSLAAAHIGGDLDLDGARFTEPDGLALFASDVVVDGSVYARDVVAKGEVRIARARIAGWLWFDGTHLENAKGDALDAGSFSVGGGVSCAEGFSATGVLNLTHAQVGNEIYLNGATLRCPDGLAFAGRRLQTDGDVRCIGERSATGELEKEFSATGEVRLTDARIGGRVRIEDAVLAGSNDGVGVSLQGLHATALVLRPQQPPEGLVDLTDARVGSFSDDKSSWPKRLRLDGFVYDQLASESMEVKDRLDWLALPDKDPDEQDEDDRYTPGPYDELAAAYRRAGYPERARRVGLEKQWRRRRELNAAGKTWNWFLWATVGYGYSTWRAAVWLVALLITGSLALAALHPAHLQPTDAAAPDFNPPLYTVDVMFPIMDLGQQSAWQADGQAAWWALGLTIAGWLLVTAVGAGLTNALRRD